MEPFELHLILGNLLSKAQVEALAIQLTRANIPLPKLIDITFDKDEQVAFRASWILETMYIQNPAYFLSDIHYFLESFDKQRNNSCQRHFAKILALMSSKKSPLTIQQILKESDTDDLVELIFSWLIAHDIPVAVKSHCLNILANFTSKHDWIREELISTMEFLVDRESIAFFAKVKQIRKQLKLNVAR